jgi:hypothetical protein
MFGAVTLAASADIATAAPPLMRNAFVIPRDAFFRRKFFVRCVLHNMPNSAEFSRRHPAA